MAAVLIADASEDVALLYAVALRRHGHSVSVWRRGEPLPEQLDVAVVDATLKTAETVAAAVREESAGAVLIATGIRTLPPGAEPCGAGVYFRKPFALADLATAVALAAPTAFLPTVHPSSY